jgi:hypothetical protein
MTLEAAAVAAVGSKLQDDDETKIMLPAVLTAAEIMASLLDTENPSARDRHDVAKTTNINCKL